MAATSGGGPWGPGSGGGKPPPGPWRGDAAWDLVEAVVAAGGVPQVNAMGPMRVVQRSGGDIRWPRMAWRLLRDADGMYYGFGGRGLSRLASLEAGFLPSDGAVLVAEYPVTVSDTLTGEGETTGGGSGWAWWVAGGLAAAKLLRWF